MALARVRVVRRGIVAWTGTNPDVLLYSTVSFLGAGVCGLRRCRSAVQLLEPLVVLSRPGVVWDFPRYHCHVTLNGSVVVRAHCRGASVWFCFYIE